MHAQPRILAHRALLHGADRACENRLPSLRRAVSLGFDVEFDVNLDPRRTRLVLAHDEVPWEPELDALEFLRMPGGGRHALNVKSLYTLDAVLGEIEQAGTREHFFLFDFELLAGDLAACRFLMDSIGRRGFAVAHRMSEREPHLDRFLTGRPVAAVWLDEFDERWLRRHHVEALTERGTATYYVSPDLHRPTGFAELDERWDEVASWGVTGICTDHPTRLRDRQGGAT
jgi:glycerophosphoryl diester phosphodiesterase